MSFELKFDISSTGRKHDDAAASWSCDRDCLPVALRGRVSKTEWESTYDSVTEHCESHSAAAFSRRRRRHSLFQRLPKYVAERQKYEEGWIDILKSQQSKYSKYNIQVLPSRDPTDEDRIIGLKFEVGPPPRGPAIFGSATAPYCSFSTRQQMIATSKAQKIT